jgi:NAD(P)-dependent dehydrogenase (short-subunit alcohol dehydrogenase family)
MTGAVARPIVLVTGAAGNLGRSVAAALADGNQIGGLFRKAREE